MTYYFKFKQFYRKKSENQIFMKYGMYTNIVLPNAFLTFVCVELHYAYF